VTELGRKQLLINGEWRDASDGATMAVVNPATEVVIAEIRPSRRRERRSRVRGASSRREIEVACCGSWATG
jgi:succinate-semialdehyde dehydrogenase/glutarate-semialdehyde dehydrogenase